MPRTPKHIPGGIAVNTGSRHPFLGYPLIASIFALQAGFFALGAGLMGRHA